MVSHDRCWLPSIAFAVALAAAASAAHASDAGHASDAVPAGLRDQILTHWNIVPGLQGADKVHVRIRMKLDRSGHIIGRPDVRASGGPMATRTAFANSAYRAVIRAAPFENLPFDTYAAPIDLIVNFEAGNLGL